MTTRNMQERRKLTDTYIRNLKPAPAGERNLTPDLIVTGLAAAVDANGRKFFEQIARFNQKNPTWRVVGEYGDHDLTLEAARKKAQHWRELIKSGKDPRVEQEKERRAELLKRATTFGSVAEAFIVSYSKMRSARTVTRDIRKELIGRWGDRPISDITPEDAKAMIREITARPAPYFARLILSHGRSIFNWAIDQDEYGLTVSPFDRIKPKSLIGPKHHRQRVFRDDSEIRALWNAASSLGYPFGPLYQLLLLTGARLTEIAEGRWCEIDITKRIWTIPPERFKSDVTHLIPLTDPAIDILGSLKRLPKGDCIFSSTLGATPISGFSRAKERIDAAMKLELGTVEAWRTHDIRRTVRTRLASLRVPDAVAELVIGHGKKGLQRVYDQHSYEPELREALALWAGKLRDIVTPPPENVIGQGRFQAQA